MPTTAAIAPGINTFGVVNHTGILWRSEQIDGDRIVWGEHTDNSSAYSVWLYNITTGEKSLIPPSLSDGPRRDVWLSDQYPVSISGSRIVWAQDMNIWMYDISSGKTTALTTNSGDFNAYLEHVDPAISGDVVVWRQRKITDQDSRNMNIVAYSIPSGKTTVVSDGKWEKTNARIDGDRVVWEDSRKDKQDRDIYLYNLTTGKESVVCSAPDTQREPKISGNRIVWDDHRTGDWDVYAYDIPTGKETLIATGPEEQEDSAISGDRIVWMELPSMQSTDPNDESDRLMMYDLSTREEYQILENIPGMFAPAIAGNRIIYLDLEHIAPGEQYIQRQDPVHEISLFMLDPVTFPVSTPDTIIRPGGTGVVPALPAGESNARVPTSTDNTGQHAALLPDGLFPLGVLGTGMLAVLAIIRRISGKD
ncbi:MAG: hypothetical protein ABFC78_05475 [Methanoregula sp.]